MTGPPRQRTVNYCPSRSVPNIKWADANILSGKMRVMRLRNAANLNPCKSAYFLGSLSSVLSSSTLSNLPMLPSRCPGKSWQGGDNTESIALAPCQIHFKILAMVIQTSTMVMYNSRFRADQILGQIKSPTMLWAPSAR